MTRKEQILAKVKKELALKQLKEKRNKDNLAPINGVQVATLADRENIQGTIKYFDTLSEDGYIMWTMEDNTEKRLTLPDLEEVLDLYVLRKAQIFSNYQTEKAKL